MSHRDFARPGTNINTVEGVKAGGRAARLTREREADQKAFEDKKAKIEADASKGLGRIDDKFDKTILNTVLSGGGLQTAAQYKAAQSQPARRRGAAPEEGPGPRARRPRRQAREDAADRPALVRRRVRGRGGGSGAAAQGAASLKCPDVDTAFLPDAARDAAKAERRAQAAAEWLAAQEEAKKAPLQIVYSYWDGAGHRRKLTTERGATIHAFLEKARDQLSREFPDLRRVAAENLMYVKEDLIVPSHFSFHDLIVAKARGKSGPMFDFSAREDVRLVGDVRTESDAVAPGEGRLRAWYERNKHIFPASRWDNYEPGVDHGERYTVK